MGLSFASFNNFLERTYFFFWRATFGRGLKKLGKGTRLVYPDIVKGEQGIEIGNDVYIGRKAWLEVLPNNPTGSIKIGSGTYIGRYAHIVVHSSLEIGEEVLIADKVFIADNTHTFDDPRLPPVKAPVKALAPVQIGAGAWLGENVCILGASVGKRAVVAANATVISDIPDFAVAAGSPAKVIRYLELNADEKVANEIDD